MTVLITGAAGFIGSECAHRLIDRGTEVIGIDNLNAYYDPGLKEARLARLAERKGFRFVKGDISEREGVGALIEREGAKLTHILHLAAQAGVRYSLIDPYAYVQANVMGQVTLLEAARSLPRLEHFVYASSSSVYGDDAVAPFSVEERCDRPVSLYAATKRADEMITHAYAHLYGIRATGLRYFTVYGPWGRPDMAYFSFTRRILAGEPIEVFNHGDMLRDFTYIDDIVAGTLAALERPAKPETGAPVALYNLGNNRPERLPDFIAAIEAACGRKAETVMKPMQPGDVHVTAADIAASARDLGFSPKTPISEGVPRFVAWYRDYFGV